ncbi:hypothetical protein N7535_009004 [Penicillium sp. DV-2018c]|nr:hypothetical protein N7535_009004 [Penicillium sp. DV-2018c]
MVANNTAGAHALRKQTTWLRAFGPGSVVQGPSWGLEIAYHIPVRSMKVAPETMVNNNIANELPAQNNWAEEANIQYLGWLTRPGERAEGSILIEFTSPVAANRAIASGVEVPENRAHPIALLCLSPGAGQPSKVLDLGVFTPVVLIRYHSPRGSWTTVPGPKALSHAVCFRKACAPAALLAIMATSPEGSFRAATNQWPLGVQPSQPNPLELTSGCVRGPPQLTLSPPDPLEFQITPGDGVLLSPAMGAAVVAWSLPLGHPLAVSASPCWTFNAYLRTERMKQVTYWSSVPFVCDMFEHP